MRGHAEAYLSEEPKRSANEWNQQEWLMRRRSSDSQP